MMAQPDLAMASVATLEFISALVETLEQRDYAYKEALLAGLWRELWNLEELLKERDEPTD